MTCFFEEKNSEIVVLNELKLLPEEANHYLSFSGYASMFKLRVKNPRRGGGVAILVKKDLNYEQVSSFDSFNKELVLIKVFSMNVPFKLSPSTALLKPHLTPSCSQESSHLELTGSSSETSTLNLNP